MQNQLSLTMTPLRVMLLCTALAVCGNGTQALAEPRAVSFLLSNGMQVVAIPDHRVPVVTHMVWYRVGAADDPWVTSGVAHFLEHLMFKSTLTMKSGAYSRRLAALGGRGNAQTNYDTTVYFQRVPKENLRVVMELEADRMVNLRLDEEDVRTEREVILEERRSTVDGDPVRVLGEQMQAALYLNHPYHRPRLGWAHEMSRLSQHDAVAFYKRYYAPNNAVLIVAGDATPEHVRNLAELVYGGIPSRDVPSRARAEEPEAVAARHVDVERPGTATFIRYYQVPSFASAKEGQAESLDLLAQILGGDDSSRLYGLLVAERLASSASCDYIAGDRDSGRLAFVIIPSAQVPFDKIETVLDAALADIRDNGISQRDLDRAKTALEARRIFEGDDLVPLARRYGEAVAVGRSIADVETEGQRVQARDVEDIKRAAQQFLVARASVSGRVTSPDAAAQSAPSK